MINAKVFIGVPVSFQGLCDIHPPTVGDVLGLEEFGRYRTILTISQEDIEDNYFPKPDDIDASVELPTPYENLIKISRQDTKVKKLVEDAIKYFTHKKATIDLEEEIIIIGELEDLLTLTDITNMSIIDSDNFFDFQNLIRICCGESAKEPYNTKVNVRLRKMKAKARYRDKVKAKGSGGMTLEDSLASICCMGIGINPLNIREISYAAMSKLTSKFQQRERYDIDIRSLIAGADAKKVKPQYWMNKLQEK